MLFTKIFVIFSTLFSLVLCNHFPPEVVKEWVNAISPFESECMPTEFQAKEEVDAMIKKGHVKDCLNICQYLVCLYKNLKLFDSNGEIMENAVMEKFSYMTPSITKKCVAKTVSEIETVIT